MPCSVATKTTVQVPAYVPPPASNLKLVGCSVQEAVPGQYATGHVIVQNTGNAVGEDTVEGTMTNPNTGLSAGHFNSTPVTVQSGQTQIFPIQSTGLIGIGTQGMTFPVTFTLQGQTCKTTMKVENLTIPPVITITNVQSPCWPGRQFTMYVALIAITTSPDMSQPQNCGYQGQVNFLGFSTLNNYTIQQGQSQQITLPSAGYYRLSINAPGGGNGLTYSFAVCSGDIKNFNIYEDYYGVGLSEGTPFCSGA